MTNLWRVKKDTDCAQCATPNPCRVKNIPDEDVFVNRVTKKAYAFVSATSNCTKGLVEVENDNQLHG